VGERQAQRRCACQRAPRAAAAHAGLAGHSIPTIAFGALLACHRALPGALLTLSRHVEDWEWRQHHREREDGDQSRLHPRRCALCCSARLTTPLTLLLSRSADTAQSYRNEVEAGKALRAFPRDKVFLTTKFSGSGGLDIPTSIRNSLKNVRALLS
jgi:hypothetical protein